MKHIYLLCKTYISFAQNIYMFLEKPIFYSFFVHNTWLLTLE